MTTLKKHVDSDDAIIVKRIEEEENVLVREPFEKQLAKKSIMFQEV